MINPFNIQKKIAMVTVLICAIHNVQANNADIKWPCLFPPTMSAVIPGDTKQSNQAGFNCLAWQQFIALNWSVKPGSSAANFGDPGDYSPVVFETYMNVHEFLKPDGSKPPQWHERAYVINTQEKNTQHARTMFGTSKVTVNFDADADLNEAFPENSNKAWLADKKGNLVWYEILVNRDEFEYFYEHEFYNSVQQYKAAKAGHALDLPKGNLSGKVGAMEFKVAWLTVTDPENNKWNKYKMTRANICSDDGHCKLQDFALVGLHIIHKTSAQASWIWSTFEHQDNAPDLEKISAVSSNDDYTFYNPQCIPQDIDPMCVNGVINQKTSCDVNVSPQYPLSFIKGEPAGKCLAYPIQVAREYAITNSNENPVMDTNKAAHALIKQDNNDSVYQYYNLINVLWNDSPVDENAGKKVPINQLSETGFRPNPSAQPIANTMMETYIQNATCVACHSSATLNPPKGGQEYTSDYSFIFGMAGSKDNDK